MTRALGIVAALALLALAVFWALGDEPAELGAPRALTSAGADDARGAAHGLERSTPDAWRADPTPLASDSADAAPEPPPLVGKPFALRVTDEAGRPLPGLPLRVDALAQTTLPESTIRFAETDARGLAEFGPLPRGVRLRWSCRDPAWFLERWLPAGTPRPVGDLDAPGRHSGQLWTDDGPVVEFVARRLGVSLRGTLVDAAGEPLVEQRVRVYERAPPTPAEPRRAWRQSGDTHTGVDGRFVFTLLAPGEQRVVAVEREAERRVRVHHAVAWLEPDASHDLGELPRDPLDPVQLLRLQPTLGGRPVAPAEVHARPDELRFGVHLGDDGDAPPVPLGELPGDGTDVEVRGLPRARWRPQVGAQISPGDMLLPHAAPPAHMPAFEPRTAPGAPWNFEIPFSEIVALELRLRDETAGPRPRKLLLGFLDEQGRPLMQREAEMPPPGAVIHTATWPGANTLVIVDARTSGVFPGERYGVLAVHHFEAQPPGPQLVDVVLQRSPEVQGTLRDADGEPVRGAALHFRLPGDGALGADERTLTRASSNDRGVFRARGLPPDTEVELTLRHGGVEHTHRFRTAEPGATQQLEAITLDVQAPSEVDRAWRAR